MTEHTNEIVENHKQNRNKDSLYELDLCEYSVTQGGEITAIEL